ncbi:MAG: helix-turn-helix domain-containing protein [Chloroflexi bacterium]|nr:helix-turn-helix domain-containing protein [Chloroflexota bacterium]
MNLLTVTQAAEKLGVKPVRVRQLCQQGRIKGAEKLGSTWIIPTPIDIRPGTRGPKFVKARIQSGNQT